MYRRPGFRPDYSDGPRWERRRWRPRLPTMVELIVFAVIAMLVGSIGYEIYNPCVRYSPVEKTTYTTVSCGENCFYTYPTMYHECIERTR